VQPGLGAGPVLTLGTTPPGFVPIELDLQILLESEATTGEAGASFTSFRGGLFICPASFGHTSQLRLCVGQHLGYLKATGFGFDQNETSSRPGLWAGFRGRFLHSLSKTFWLHGSLALEAAAIRDEFRYVTATGESVTLYQSPLAALGVELGVGLRF
jgi:hypothetical protein